MRRFLLIVAVVFMCLPLSAGFAQQSAGVQQPVTQQEIDRLKRQIDEDTRSSVEGIMDYHTETGDLNNRLDFLRYGGRWNIKSGSSSAFHITGTRTNYLPVSGLFNQQGINLTGGVQTRVSEAVQANLEGGFSRFSTDTTTINARGSLTYNASDQTHFYATFARSNVEESLLSTTGVRPVVGPFAGQLVGAVMENRFVGGGSARPWGNIDIFGEGGAGNRAGSNVPSNFFKTFGGGAGYSILSRTDEQALTLLRAAYELNYFGFDDNRFGFGGASLTTRGGSLIVPARIGSDAIPPEPVVGPRVGGYFSPQNFVSNVARVEAKGGWAKGVSYRLSGFVGTQTYTGSNGGLLAEGFSGTVNLTITDRISVPLTYFIDTFGPYTQQSLFAKVDFKF
jgi:Cellulose synthase operon protein C C-terminus (BCSC_C)